MRFRCVGEAEQHYVVSGGVQATVGAVRHARLRQRDPAFRAKVRDDERVMFGAIDARGRSLTLGARSEQEQQCGDPGGHALSLKWVEEGIVYPSCSGLDSRMRGSSALAGIAPRASPRLRYGRANGIGKVYSLTTNRGGAVTKRSVLRVEDATVDALMGQSEYDGGVQRVRRGRVLWRAPHGA